MTRTADADFERFVVAQSTPLLRFAEMLCGDRHTAEENVVAMRQKQIAVPSRPDCAIHGECFFRGDGVRPEQASIRLPRTNVLRIRVDGHQQERRAGDQ